MRLCADSTADAVLIVVLRRKRVEAGVAIFVLWSERVYACVTFAVVLILRYTNLFCGGIDVFNFCFLQIKQLSQILFPVIRFVKLLHEIEWQFASELAVHNLVDVLGTAAALNQ